MNDTQKRILRAGVEALETGTQYVTARIIAQYADVRHSNVVYYWATTADLLDAVAIEAIRMNNKKAVARLIADGHASVSDWSATKRRAYLASLA